jgi:hypothetical protein
MKLDIKKILSLLDPVILLFRKYKTMITFVVIVGIFGFIFFRIGQFNSIEPTEQQIDEKLQDVQRPRIDKSVIEKLEKLENQNIQVQTLFQQARENPFKE